MFTSILLNLSSSLSEWPTVYESITPASVGQHLPGDQCLHHDVPRQQCAHAEDIWRHAARHLNQARSGRRSSICRNVSCVSSNFAWKRPLEIIQGVQTLSPLLRGDQQHWGREARWCEAVQSLEHQVARLPSSGHNKKICTTRRSSRAF